MTKILDVNNICDAIRNSSMPKGTEHIRAIELVVTGAAKALANHLAIDCDSADYQAGFGGLCVTFRPAADGQDCPEVIDQGDPDGEWE
jgi:hypothetical protein